MRRRWLVCLLFALAAAAAAAAQHDPPVPKELRERFGAWAEAYAESLPAYTATETVRQTRFDRKGRPDKEHEWKFRYAMRRSEDARLVESREPFESEGGKSASDATIGYFSKVALLVTSLATRNHFRMRYFFDSDVGDDTSEYVTVGYKQFSGDGLMEVDGKPVYTSGRAWVNPDDGSVVRVEEDFADKKARYEVAVDFAPEAATRGWLPVHVTVRIFEKGRLELQNEYTYSDFQPL